MLEVKWLNFLSYSLVFVYIKVEVSNVYGLTFMALFFTTCKLPRNLRSQRHCRQV